MKKFSYLILITLVSTSLFACGGSGDDENSDQSSDDIMMQVIQDGAKITDEPSSHLVTSDVAEVTCGENDYTEGGVLVVSCLDGNGDSQMAASLTCDAGYLYAYVTDGSGEYVDDGYITGTCANVFCLENGDYVEVNSCDPYSD